MGVVNVMLLSPPQIGSPVPRPTSSPLSSISSSSLLDYFWPAIQWKGQRGRNYPMAAAALKSSIILLLLVHVVRVSGETNENGQKLVLSSQLRSSNVAVTNTAAAALPPGTVVLSNIDHVRHLNSLSSTNSNKLGVNSITTLETSKNQGSFSPFTSKVDNQTNLRKTSPSNQQISDNQLEATSSSFANVVEEDWITNITSQLQTHTYLPCKLSPALLKQNQVGNKSVSWVRVRDDHILTVDRITFITDDRFQSLESNGVWTLQIKYVQPRDAGIYECQVSTEPKASAQVQLNVVVPKTELVGEQIRYVKDGSNAILRCVVRGAIESPIYISWFYGAKQIYNDSPRGWRITLERDVLDNEHDGSHSSIGSLIITSVRKRDSGNYTCSPSNSDDVTVMLHVINGEYSASAITSSSSRGRFSDLIVTIIVSVVMFRVT